MMKSNNGYWWRILALSILVRLHVSSIALRFVRNAHIDCRNGILISHKNIYPVIGLSGNYSIMPTNECTQIGDAYSYMIQIYRKFDSCGIQVHDKSFVVYVHFGVQNSTHGIMWLVHDQVICPQNAVPPLSTAIMDVREQVFMEKMNEPVYSYRVSTFTPSLMSNQSRMYLRFCMAYENDHDYHFVSIGNCIAAGEHVILTRSMFNETTFHMNSSTEINRIVCRLALTEYNGNYSSFMKYCGPHKAFEMEMLAFEDPTYDAGLTIDCKRTGNRIWSTCTAKSNMTSIELNDYREGIEAFGDDKDIEFGLNDQPHKHVVIIRRGYMEYVLKWHGCSGEREHHKIRAVIVLVIIALASFSAGIVLPVLFLLCYRVVRRRYWIWTSRNKKTKSAHSNGPGKQKHPDDN